MSTIQGEPPKNRIQFFKIVYLFFQSPSKYYPSEAIRWWRWFFHCSKQFSNSSILMCFSAFAIFCFTSSTQAKHFPLRTFFIWGKNSHLGWEWVYWEGGHGGHIIFGQKLLNSQHDGGRRIHKSPIMKWGNALKESSKKRPWSQTQPLTTMPAVHWYAPHTWLSPHLLLHSSVNWSVSMQVKLTYSQIFYHFCHMPCRHTQVFQAMRKIILMNRV